MQWKVDSTGSHPGSCVTAVLSEDEAKMTTNRSFMIGLLGPPTIMHHYRHSVGAPMLLFLGPAREKHETLVDADGRAGPAIEAMDEKMPAWGQGDLEAVHAPTLRCRAGNTTERGSASPQTGTTILTQRRGRSAPPQAGTTVFGWSSTWCRGWLGAAWLGVKSGAGTANGRQLKPKASAAAAGKIKDRDGWTAGAAKLASRSKLEGMQGGKVPEGSAVAIRRDLVDELVCSSAFDFPDGGD
jgi:hypothetical protein